MPIASKRVPIWRNVFFHEHSFSLAISTALPGRFTLTITFLSGNGAGREKSESDMILAG